MDFCFTEDQVLLRDTLRRFCRDFYSFEQRKRIVAAGEDAGLRHWHKLAELGVLALPFAENEGGLGGGMIDVMIVMEEFGRTLVVEPYLANIVLAGGVIKRIPQADKRVQLLAPLMSGAEMISLAYAEAGSRYDLRAIETRAERYGSEFRLNGTKIVVLNGANADRIIVSALMVGDARGTTSGLTLFLVDVNAQGVALQRYPTVDGFVAASVTLTDVRVAESAVLGEIGNGLELLEPSIDEALVAVGAEGVGAMAYVNEATLEYTKAREQFGVSISGFQVLQHRMVDMFIEREQTVSILYRAAMLSARGGVEAKRSASALKVQLAKACRFIGQQAVQLHGGMGIADEVPVAHYFKRLSVISQQFGDADFFAGRYATLTA